MTDLEATEKLLLGVLKNPLNMAYSIALLTLVIKQDRNTDGSISETQNAFLNHITHAIFDYQKENYKNINGEEVITAMKKSAVKDMTDLEEVEKIIKKE